MWRLWYAWWPLAIAAPTVALVGVAASQGWDLIASPMFRGFSAIFLSFAIHYVAALVLLSLTRISPAKRVFLASGFPFALALGLLVPVKVGWAFLPAVTVPATVALFTPGELLRDGLIAFASPDPGEVSLEEAAKRGLSVEPLDAKFQSASAFLVLVAVRNRAASTECKRVIRVLASGAVDAHFQPSRSCFSLSGPGADRSQAGPYSLVAQSNGGILLTGRALASSALQQSPAEILVRLAPNGEVERPLTIPGGKWCDGAFSWVRRQPDGKTLFAGGFALVEGRHVPSQPLLRLNVDGSPDESFHPGPLLDGVVEWATQDSRQRIVGRVASPLAGVHRWLADGRLDAAFEETHRAAYGLSGLEPPDAATVDTRDRLITASRTRAGGATLTRWSESGARDPAFEPPAIPFVVEHLLDDVDDGVLASSSFQANEVQLQRITRTGAPDLAYNESLRRSLRRLQLRSLTAVDSRGDGRLLLLGASRVAAGARWWVVNPDGTLSGGAP